MTNLPTPSTRIAALQAAMTQQAVDAWLVPSADPHQSEYVAEHWQARSWLSGFSGSAGTLVVTQTGAGLWTDPRYHLRAESELAGSGVTLHRFGLAGVPSYVEWLGAHLTDSATLGFDPALLSIADVARLRSRFGDKKIHLYTKRELVSELWTDRPPLPETPIFLHDEGFAGENCATKLARTRARLRESGGDALVLTALDDIAWTFNIRGGDVPFNPVAIAYALVSLHETTVFIQPDKVDATVQAALEDDGVVFTAYETIFSIWPDLPQQSRVLVDPAKTSYRLQEAIAPYCQILKQASIPATLKAIKNATEAAGLRRAHIRDGVALVRWLIWLEEAVPSQYHTEITLGEKLADFRGKGDHYWGESFGTITGYGANSAVGHYSPQPETTPTVRPTGLLLSDSGGHYLDGTTDVTRVVALGPPSAEERQVYTLVLKCHIRLATVRFPQGTTGSQLDALAREFLWREGWNCRHGIGHGVGFFLNVHEGPQRFSTDNRVALEPGMLTSNEPGVYFAGKFGVRLENLLLCVADTTTDFGDFYRFETLTLCPFDLRLVDVSLLDEQEKIWLNGYHSAVYTALSPLLDPTERAWLEKATRTI